MPLVLRSQSADPFVCEYHLISDYPYPISPFLTSDHLPLESLTPSTPSPLYSRLRYTSVELYRNDAPREAALPDRMEFQLRSSVLR